MRRLVADAAHAEAFPRLARQLAEHHFFRCAEDARTGPSLALLEIGNGIEGGTAELPVDKEAIVAEQDQVGLHVAALLDREAIEPLLGRIERRLRRDGRQGEEETQDNKNATHADTV